MKEIRMSRRKKKALSVVTALGLLILAVVATKPAFAGSNGQRIMFCGNGGDYSRVHVEGLNQNDQLVQASFFVGLDQQECSDPDNFYWVGEVTLTWQSSVSGNFPDRTSTCIIPRESQDDTTTCHAP